MPIYCVTEFFVLRTQLGYLWGAYSGKQAHIRLFIHAGVYRVGCRTGMWNRGVEEVCIEEVCIEERM